MNNHLKNKIIEEGQFPFKRRKYQYQSIKEENMVGIRDMQHRYKIMKLPYSFKNKTILDIGCSIGMVCIEAYFRKALKCVGIDYQKTTVDVGKEYIKNQKYNTIHLYTFDIDQGLEELKKVIGEEKFDYVFALSMWKHVNNEALFNIINYYCKEKCWFEAHNKQKKELVEAQLKKRLNFDQIAYLGDTLDRGVRANFVLSK